MNPRLRVVIPADDPPLVGRSDHLGRLRDICDVQLWGDRPGTGAEKLSRIQNADIVLNSRGHVKFSRSLLQQLPQLKMIAVCGIGYDAVDLDAATSQGIVVSNIPGRTATVVAEHAFALMLAVSRRVVTMTEQLRAGRWPGALGISLIGKTLGVIGTGAIGSEMIRLSRAFGMSVIAWTFNPDETRAEKLGVRFVPLSELLQQSDVVSLHVRATDRSHHLIGQQELRSMKQNAILINTARGPVVDTAALVSALKSGHMFGSGIDVYDCEPIPPTHPLLTCENVVLTPHSADQTQEGIDILTAGCVENIAAFINGTPANVVNPGVLGV
jgi:phosphoglycerate dehydrogenase-like enzyme